MANYQLLKADIDKKVYQNGHQEITGENLNSVLNAMVTTLGAGYQFMGVATPDTNPGTPDQKVFYIASTPGVYSNFGGKSVYDGETVIFVYTNQWNKEYSLRSDIILLSYWGANPSTINALPEGSFFYNTHSNKIGITTGVAGQWNEIDILYNSIFIYDGKFYIYDGNTLIDFTRYVVIPSVRRGVYATPTGFASYTINAITELLNIPKRNCKIMGLWNAGDLGKSVMFYNDSFTYLGGFNSGNEYNWDTTQVTIPDGAKYMILQTQADNIKIITDENLCTGLDLYNEQDALGKFTAIDYRIKTIEDLLSGINVVYDANGYIDESNGQISSYASARATTAYYPLSSFFTYLVTGQSKLSARLFAYYDEKKRFISAYQANQYVSNIDIETLLPKPTNAKYVRFSAWPIDAGYGAIVKAKKDDSIVNKWETKKWVVVGDSLTEKNLRATKNYHDYVSEFTGINVVNYGESGTGYANRQSTGRAFYQRVVNVPIDTDVITIFGSFNDFSASLPLGNIDDADTTTLCGCINKTIDVIQSRLPLVNLGIVTPTPWSSTQPTVAGNSAGENYVNAIIAICKYRSIPCLDLYHCSNLRPWNASFRSLAYKRDGTYTESTAETPNAIQVTAELLDYVKENGVPNASVGDWVLMSGGGVHPDEDGHKIIASRFEAFLDALLLS